MDNQTNEELTISLGKLRKAVKIFEDFDEENNKGGDNYEIPFESIIAILFPNVYTNIREKISSERTKAFIEGLTAQIDLPKEKVRMSGVRNDLADIYELLLKAKKNLFYTGYSMADAPYHGWKAKDLEPISNTIDGLDKLISRDIAYLQCALGIEFDDDAWRKAEVEQ